MPAYKYPVERPLYDAYVAGKSWLGPNPDQDQVIRHEWWAGFKSGLQSRASVS